MFSLGHVGLKESKQEKGLKLIIPVTNPRKLSNQIAPFRAFNSIKFNLFTSCILVKPSPALFAGDQTPKVHGILQ